MTDYKKLVEALRCCAENFGCPIECPRYSPADEGVRACVSRLEKDAAAAIEALDSLLDQNTQRCEALRKQLREAHESYEKHLNELESQLPKRGEWIWIQKANGGQYKGCSVCHAPIPTDSMLDYLDDEDCEFCYSCGAKMGGTDERRT